MITIGIALPELAMGATTALTGLSFLPGRFGILPPGSCPGYRQR